MCSTPRCPNKAIKRGLCAEHLREQGRRYRSERGPKPYDRARHKVWRKQVLGLNPVCCDCGKALSADADHIVPLEDGGTYSLDNGQGLCRSCHSKKTRRENARE